MASYCVVACCFLSLDPAYCNTGVQNCYNVRVRVTGQNSVISVYSYPGKASNRVQPTNPVRPNRVAGSSRPYPAVQSTFPYPNRPTSYTAQPASYPTPYLPYQTNDPAPTRTFTRPPPSPNSLASYRPFTVRPSPSFPATVPNPPNTIQPGVPQTTPTFGENTRNDAPFDGDNSVDGGSTESPPVPLISRRLFAGLRDADKLSVQLNYDGTKVGYVAPYRGTRNIWVQDLEADGNGRSTATVSEPRPVTFDNRGGIIDFSFTSLPNIMLYSLDNDGDENTRLFKIDISLRRPTQQPLTPPGAKASVEATSVFSDPSSVIVKMNARDPRYFDRYRLNLLTGELTMIFRNDNLNGRFLFDDALSLQLVANVTTGGSVDYLSPRRDNEGNIVEWLPVKSVSFDDSVTTRPIGFDLNGTSLFWIDSTTQDLGFLAEQNLIAGATTPLFQPKQADISNVVTNPQTGRPIIVFEYYDYPVLESLDGTLAADIENMKLLNPNGRISYISPSKDMTKFLVTIDLRNASSQYYLYNRDTASGRLLFSAMADLDQHRLGTKRAFQVRSRDGLVQLCYLTTPPEVDSRGNGVPEFPLRLVLLVHDGPWSRDYPDFGDSAQFYANRGYAVLQCNYRGSGGFGKRHLLLSRGEWAARMHTDLADGVQWAVQRRIADPRRVAVVGTGYGGYAALIGLTFTPDLFACGIDIAGQTNLVTLLSGIPPYWTPSQERLFAMIGGSPDTDQGRQYLLSKSPITYASTIRKPLLIFHGANDVEVKLNESDQMVSALKRSRIPVTYVLFPDEGHRISQPENLVTMLAYTEHFLKDCLGGRAEPFKDDANRSSAVVIEQGNLVLDPSI